MRPGSRARFCVRVDAVDHGVLANIACAAIGGPVKNESKSHRNLVSFLSRIRERYFGNRAEDLFWAQSP